MKCPVCRSRSRVIRTEASDDETVRRRECEVCGERFTTSERSVNRRQPTAISSGHIMISIGQLLGNLGIHDDESIRQLATAMKIHRNDSTQPKETRDGDER